MSDQLGLIDRIAAAAAVSGRYKVDAYLFLWQALERAVSRAGEPRHVTGEELLGGVRELARERFGPMAKDVLNAWGVAATADFGQIVFDLVGAGLLRKTDEDSLEDFRDKFDFQIVFEDDYFTGGG